MFIKTQIADITFDNCLMNAAGVYCMTKEELEQIVASQAATFVTKTATLQSRPGNPEPRYRDVGLNSINSMGLPNLGLDYYLDLLTNDPHQEQRFLSISPMNADDTPTLFSKIKQHDFKGFVELNLSCPNIPGKAQIAYDFDQTQRILDQVFDLYQGKLGVKLPPYFDQAHFDQMASILNQYPLTFINSINSLGNGIMIDDLSMMIAPKQGFGGIGGPCIKPWALANVHAFYQRLKPEIQIIGTGGVTCGRDVFEHILCGASMVQVGTLLHQKGPQVFERLIQELKDEMATYGYQTLADFKGKVQYL
ncbi:dihydroorotate oxidase [Vaginisenegalia massiliensis]|uniref:dihydroorotate oxidase n=1 Tax=Vaginisenegalia massiliensis TaxID=2058294 RepID=UPI000F539100|nr:dihydroorotate oxidase [Vaginisenegalia massiliensis]